MDPKPEPQPNPHKGGRPKLPDVEKRTDRVEVRLTTAEKIAFRAKAEANGLNVSDWLRMLGEGHAPRPPSTALDHQLLSELNRIGVNVNQIARALNRGRGSPTPLRDVADELRDIIDKVAQRL